MVTADTLVKALIGFALTAALSLSSWAAISIVDLRERMAKHEVTMIRDRGDVEQIRTDVRSMLVDMRDQRDLLLRIAAALDVPPIKKNGAPPSSGR